MNTKWSSGRTIKFLELYEANPCLWDFTSNLYKNREAREKAYSNIAKSIEIDGFDIQAVKAKIRSLRNAYTLELAKIEKSKKSGSSSNGIYKPKLSWFSVADRILHNVVQIRESQSTEIESEDVNDVKEVIDTSQPAIGYDPLPCSETKGLSRTSTTAALKSSTSRSTKRKIQGSTECAIEELREISNKLNDCNKNDDEFEYFGKLIASQLRKLPDTVALESMAFIQAFLIQKRLRKSTAKKWKKDPIQ